MGLLGAIALLEGLGMIHSLLGSWLLDRMLEGSVTTESAEAYDTQTLVYGLVWLAIYIPTVIAFLAWLSRSVANAPALGAGIPPSSPRAAIVWWFVPFANLVKPYQIVKDLYERLALLGDPRGKTRLVLAWWLLYLLSNLVGNVGSGLYGRSDDLEGLRTAFFVLAFGHLLSTIAAVFAILVVRAIQAGEETFAARVLTGAAAPASAPRPPLT
jgi:hypothetical protein